MTKPHKPKTATKQKAPKATRPEAPFERNHEDPPRARRPEGRDSPRNPHTAAARQQPKKSRRCRRPGARINRRAADRLRAGYLWVYASDIEVHRNRRRRSARFASGGR